MEPSSSSIYPLWKTRILLKWSEYASCIGAGKWWEGRGSMVDHDRRTHNCMSWASPCPSCFTSDFYAQSPRSSYGTWPIQWDLTPNVEVVPLILLFFVVLCIPLTQGISTCQPTLMPTTGPLVHRFLIHPRPSGSTTNCTMGPLSKGCWCRDIAIPSVEKWGDKDKPHPHPHPHPLPSTPP